MIVEELNQKETLVMKKMKKKISIVHLEAVKVARKNARKMIIQEANVTTIALILLQNVPSLIVLRMNFVVRQMMLIVSQP